MSKEIRGQCLCGAVQVTASVDTPAVRACHCDMCRQHGSGPFFSIETLPDSIAVTGTATVFASSEWGGRGFCATCGSTLWYETKDGGARNLSAGLFPDAGGGKLTVEYFTDKCPQAYALNGDHKKLTTQETLAIFAPEELEKPND
ncbi:GFA family protein [Sulfitobacter geojensis]|uniref:GFA family protein n=1 Tax=Sulfitobacter geojensis TaxID=1342299 RepID=UPI0007D9DA34|nr:GFA family protein [Sulfitobacter geojensis]OAN84956.1 glutathione-dependent formaldehyde-activating protein [Sulfitobacter geojensis]